jgi:hypothetical protein
VFNKQILVWRASPSVNTLTHPRGLLGVILERKHTRSCRLTWRLGSGGPPKEDTRIKSFSPLSFLGQAATPGAPSDLHSRYSYPVTQPCVQGGVMVLNAEALPIIQTPENFIVQRPKV